MRENAEQILRIVKGTYPSIDFDIRESDVRPCSESGSDGDMLACLWAIALKDINSNDQDGLQKALGTLSAVGTSDELWQMV